MSAGTLIGSVLTSVWNLFYKPNLPDFRRDERALRKAISRYGHDCAQRGWDFSERDVLADIMRVLTEIKRTGAAKGYLPVYLEGAISRSIGLRAEELNARAKAVSTQVSRVMERVSPVQVVIQPSLVDVLSAVHREEKAAAQARRAAIQSRSVEARKQLSFF